MTTKSRRIVNGYVLLYRPDHFNCLKGDNWDGYVYEHRYVKERELNRPLTPDEQVHHLNCDKQNNDPANLIVVSRADHRRIHDWIDNGAAVYESHGENGVNSTNAKSGQRLCVICEGCLSKTQKQACSTACQREWLRRVKRKVERPNYSQLLEDVSALPMTKVAAKYGVSDNSVRKWLKIYERDMSTLSQAEGTLSEGAETSGEVKPS